MSTGVEGNPAKRTDKHKKKTTGGFYSEFKKWDTRGKGTHQLRAMVEDMRKAIWYQTNRISRLKYVLEQIKEKYQKRIAALRVKVNTRDVRIKKLVGQVTELKKENKSLKVSEKREALKVSTRDTRIKNLEKEVVRLERKVEVKERRVVKSKEEIRGLKAEVRKMEKGKLTATEKKRQKVVRQLLSKPLTQRIIDLTDYSVRTAMFLKDRGLSIDDLSILSQVHANHNKLMTQDMVGISGRQTIKLKKQGYINNEYIGDGSSGKYWYLTTEGEKTVQDLLNHLSYGKVLEHGK